VPVDVVFGGQFFAQARAADLGLDLTPESAPELARAGALLRAVAQRELRVAHPVNPDIDRISLVMLTGRSTTPGIEHRNTVVLPNGPVDVDDSSTWTGSLDRSPCGTGTCGRMAALHARGLLKLNTPFVHESILGTTFIGSIAESAPVGPHPAVLPTISGRAWITGFGQYVLDETDPFPEGYVLPDIWGRAATEPTVPSCPVTPVVVESTAPGLPRQPARHTEPRRKLTWPT
jgi:proline racemase